MRTETKNPRWLRGRNDVRVLSLGLVLGAGTLFVSIAGGQGQSVLPEVPVTAAAIPDNEYDSGRNGVPCSACNFGAGNARIVFSGADNRLWVANIDPQTGNYNPADGQGLLLDTNAAAPTDFGNGPEWFDSGLGSGFVYTQYVSGQPQGDTTARVAVARMVNGAWTITTLSAPRGRASPDATKNPSDSDVYINYVSAPKGNLYWRKLSDINTEHELPISHLTDGNSRRWVPDTHKIIFQGHDPADPLVLRDQIYTYDIDSGELEQLTNNPKGVLGGMMWRAPEFGNEYAFFTMVKERRQILVYRKLPGADGVMRWTIVKTIDSPAELPYFFSPEVLTHNGRSYIFATVSSAAAFFDRTVPNQIAISGVDPLRLDARLVTNDTGTPRLRLDPEYYVTAQGPFIYYSRLVPETGTNPAISDGVWRVDLGLGPLRP